MDYQFGTVNCKSEYVRSTRSVCPVCLDTVSAEIIRRDTEYLLEKTCVNHGLFSTVVWRGDSPSLEDWGAYTPPSEAPDEQPNCPHGCGLCSGHLQKTCCILVEVTSRCNLSCPFCFAQSGKESVEPTVEEFSQIFRHLVSEGKTFVQLSGGEPTLRDDLTDIVAAAKEAGCEHIQLNSNGIRLGNDPGYTAALAQAGLSFVFMQFDGTDDAIYEKLRGLPLLAQKQAAIQACADNLLGVTLVPTVVPRVNDHNMGEIVRFGMANSPAVRGVHFQPVSYFGRYPLPPTNAERITLPEVLNAIERQTDGRIKVSDLLPSACDHPRCGFHGDFVIMPDTLVQLSPKRTDSCCQKDAHLKNRNFVARRWKRTDNETVSIVHAAGAGRGQDARKCCQPNSLIGLDEFVGRVKSHGFTITGMAFQDAYTLDIERLRRCSLHVYRDGKTVPFCARYLTKT